jgi:hypothetical protein
LPFSALIPVSEDSVIDAAVVADEEARFWHGYRLSVRYFPILNVNDLVGAKNTRVVWLFMTTGFLCTNARNKGCHHF